MSTSGSPVAMNMTTNGPNGPVTQADPSIGGTAIPLMNPGSVDPSQVNSAADQYLNNNASMYNQFSNSAAGGAFNPQFYAGMQGQMQNNIQSSLGNQYSAMGLSGSSAEMGALNQATNQNQMAWMNRQQSDQQKAMSGLEGLNQQGYQQTMGIQNQYGQFQDTYGQDILGLLGISQQQQAGNQQMLGNIISGVAGAAGTAAGGA